MGYHRRTVSQPFDDFNHIYGGNNNNNEVPGMHSHRHDSNGISKREGGGSSGEEEKGVEAVGDQERERHFNEAQNELSELVKERKVKSTLVLLKKQHPSYVEGMPL